MLLDIASGKKDLWKELMPPDPAGVITVSPVNVTPDWKFYAYSYQRSLADLYVVEGLRVDVSDSQRPADHCVVNGSSHRSRIKSRRPQ